MSDTTRTTADSDPSGASSTRIIRYIDGKPQEFVVYGGAEPKSADYFVDAVIESLARTRSFPGEEPAPHDVYAEPGNLGGDKTALDTPIYQSGGDDAALDRYLDYHQQESARNRAAMRDLLLSLISVS